MEWTDIVTIVSGILAVTQFIWAWRRRATAGGINFMKWLRQTKRSYPFLLGIVLAAVAIVFAFIHIDEISIDITYPEDGATGPHEITVRGTSSHIPVESNIWICVFAPNNRYYPQPGPATLAKEGEWMATAWIGTNGEESDKRFGILAVLTDEEAAKELLDYQRESERTRNWLGMDTLPRGAVVYDQITVIHQ